MVAAGCRIDDVSSALFIPGVTQTCHVLVQGLKTLYSNISLFFSLSLGRKWANDMLGLEAAEQFLPHCLLPVY